MSVPICETSKIMMDNRKEIMLKLSYQFENFALVFLRNKRIINKITELTEEAL